MDSFDKRPNDILVLENHFGNICCTQNVALQCCIVNVCVSNQNL